MGRLSRRSSSGALRGAHIFAISHPPHRFIILFSLPLSNFFYDRASLNERQTASFQLEPDVKGGFSEKNWKLERCSASGGHSLVAELHKFFGGL